MSESIHPPWDAETTIALNRIQNDRYFHPYTCGTCRAVLVATTEGLKCPTDGCGYTQDWAHPVPPLFMENIP